MNIAAALRPFASDEASAPYVAPGYAFAVVLPARAKAPFGKTRKGHLRHRPDEIVSVCADGRICYGARWLCGARTPHAILISDGALLPAICQNCEDAAAPVVYRCFSAIDDLLYVGSAKFRTARMKYHATITPWWGEVARIATETYPTLSAARVAERRAIWLEKPRYNVQGMERAS